MIDQDAGLPNKSPTAPAQRGARLNERSGERRGEPTCASAAATACREENQQRAPGRSGQRSTTVCRVSGECSSTCLREEIRKLLTSPLSPDGCQDFYSAQPLMNKFLLNIENTLPALSGRASSTELNLNSWGFFSLFPEAECHHFHSYYFSSPASTDAHFCLICLEIGAQNDKVKCVEMRVDSNQWKEKKTNKKNKTKQE